MCWDRVVEKFHLLSEAFAEVSLRDERIHAVQELDTQPLAHFLNLLAKVRPAATFAKGTTVFSKSFDKA